MPGQPASVENPKREPIGGNEGMSPVCWSQSPDDISLTREPEGKPLPTPPEPTPTESPGVFVEHPLERWSPRDLVVGLSRLVRWTGAAIVRGVATS